MGLIKQLLVYALILFVALFGLLVVALAAIVITIIDIVEHYKWRK